LLTKHRRIWRSLLRTTSTNGRKL